MRFLLIIFFLFSFSIVSAHGTHGSGIVAGLSHPIMGLDHLLAIFSMALYAKVVFKENAWLIIFSFVAAMVVGGLVGIGSTPFPLEETIISFSVILYGLLLGLNLKVPLKIYLLIGLIIGFVHGHAHGLEMPDETTTIQYVPGYALGSIIIAAFGEYIGRHLANDNIRIARFAGGFAVGMGLMILFG